MKIEADSIDELIQKSDKEELFREIDRIIVETAPELKRQLFKGSSITMIGYGEMPWKNASSSGLWPLISVAPQKGTVNLYIAAEKDGETLTSVMGSELGKVSLGKCCIRVRSLKNFEPDGLRKLVRETLKWADVKNNKFGRNCARPVEEES